jgi:hypothetical protein
LEVSDELHTLAALTPEKELPVPIGYYSGRIGKEKNIASTGT